MRRRLDAALVHRGLAPSRERARELVVSGNVMVSGLVASKPATMVGDDAPILLHEVEDDGYASRGAHKLLGALAAFPVEVAGRKCLDAGASTGGFTDVLLRAEADHVIAVDVGYGQMVWRLQSDDRVTVMDRTNVRELKPDQLAYRPDLVVSDLSFISLTLVLPALAECAAPQADFLLMVKPQFEVGRERVGAKGVVRDPELRVESVETVARKAAELGLGTAGVTASPLPGPSGNVEYFLWLRTGAPHPESADIVRAVEEGPQ